MSYDIHLDDKYGQMNLVDIPAELAAHEPWFNQTLTTVNDAVVRLGIIDGDFHWHKHDGEDEFFLVLEGTLLLDFEDRENRRAQAPAGRLQVDRVHARRRQWADFVEVQHAGYRLPLSTRGVPAPAVTL